MQGAPGDHSRGSPRRQEAPHIRYSGAADPAPVSGASALSLHPPGRAGSGTTLSGSGFQRRDGGIDKRAGGRRDFRPAVRSDVSRASPRNLFDFASR